MMLVARKHRRLLLLLLLLMVELLRVNMVQCLLAISHNRLMPLATITAAMLAYPGVAATVIQCPTAHR
jgi:hypothetical protein